MKSYILSIALAVAVLLAIAALAVSLLTLYGLLQARQAALTSVVETRAALGELEDLTIETSLPLRHEFPVHTQVPFQQEFVLPVQATIPISTVVRVPVEIPVLGTYYVSVPVETQVDVDLQLIIPIDQTFEMDSSVTVDTEVPLQLDVGQMGLNGLLEQVDGALGEIEQVLERPFGGED